MKGDRACPPKVKNSRAPTARRRRPGWPFHDGLGHPSQLHQGRPAAPLLSCPATRMSARTRAAPRAPRWTLQASEYEFYSCYMSGLAADRLLVTPIIAPATPSTPGWRLTAEEEATAVAELKQTAAGCTALLAECAGLALGYGEHQPGAARYRHIAELCVAAGVDQTLVEAWIGVGRQRASAAAVTTHKACVLWDREPGKTHHRPVGSVWGRARVVSVNVGPLAPQPGWSRSQ